MKKTLILLMGLAVPLTAHAQPPASVRREVTHLLAYIESSGCEFFRNGTWSNARTAQLEVRSKYESSARMDRIHTTQEFIDSAASASSLSGNPYRVRCGLRPPVLSAAWLSDELARYQALPR